MVDFKAQARLGCLMDNDTRDLIIQLCTEAATRMEDASVTALTIQSASEHEVREVLNELVAVADQISALVKAARAMSE